MAAPDADWKPQLVGPGKLARAAAPTHERSSPGLNERQRAELINPAAVHHTRLTDWHRVAYGFGDEPGTSSPLCLLSDRAPTTLIPPCLKIFTGRVGTALPIDGGSMESLVALEYPNGRTHETSVTTSRELEPGAGFDLHGRRWQVVGLVQSSRSARMPQDECAACP